MGQPKRIDIRPPHNLRKTLEKAARENKRSLHAEILFRLHASFKETETSYRLRIIEDELKQRRVILRAIEEALKKRGVDIEEYYLS